MFPMLADGEVEVVQQLIFEYWIEMAFWRAFHTTSSRLPPADRK